MAEYRLGFDADTGAAVRSINELQKVISKVAKDFNEAEIGSREFARTASELSQLTLGLKTARGAVVDIDKAYRDLNKAVEANFAVQTKALGAATKYHKDVLQLAQESAKEEDRLRNKNFQAEQNDWDRRLKIAVAAKNKIAAQEKAIMDFRAGMGSRGAIPSVASPVRGGINFLDSPDYKKAMADAAAKAAGQAKSGGGVAIPAELKFQPYSLAYYESKLKALSAQARLIAPESKKWKELNTDILKAERGIERIQKRQKLGPTAGQRAGAAGGAFLYGGGMGGGLGSAFGGIAGGLAGGVPGAFAGAAIGQVVDNLGQSLAAITSQTSKVQQLQRGLALASIDAKDFAQAQAAVADTSARLFIPIEQVTKSFAQLRVNTKQYGLSVEETKQILEGTILAVSSVGGSADDVDGAMRAVVQILSKGSVQAEELRGQLGERFPGAVVKFAQANKLSFEELQKGLQQGKIGIKEFVTFAKQNYEDYAAFSETLATAPEFAGRRLQIALEQVGIAIGSLFTDAGADIQNTLTNTLNAITSFVKNNEAELQTIASGLASLVKLTEQAGAAIVRIIGNDIARAFRDVADAAIVLRNMTGGGNVESVTTERQLTNRRINEKFQDVADLRRKGAVGDLALAEGELKSLQNRRNELDKQFRELGGNAAYQATRPTGLTFGGPGAGMDMSRQNEDTAGRQAASKAVTDAARLASQQQQSAIDAANLQNALDKARFDGLTVLGDQAFQHAVSLIDARNNYELAGLDSIASRQEKFQQDLQRIELDRIDTVRQATQKAVEASLKFAAAQNTAVAAGAGRVQGGGTGLLQGSTGISSGPHFDVRRADGGRISEAEARALFSEEVRRQLTMTSGYGPRRAPAPGASTFHRGIDLAGPANTPLSLAPGYSLMGVGQEGGLGYAASVQGPQGQSYKVGHLQKPGAGYTMQRREAKAGGNLQVEQLERSNALEEASLVAINATTEALAKREALIASNINTIFPVAEQRLQNDLTKIRNDLQLKGMPQEYIDYQEESYKASYEMSEAIKKNTEDTNKYQQTISTLQDKKAKGVALTTNETNALTFYTGAIAQNKAALNDLARQQVEYNIAALEGAIATMKNADALKAQQETMNLIKSSVESASSSYKGFMKEIITGGDPREALKKFQEAITDQVLTVFLDFAMKPVEKIFKDQLSALFGVPTEEKARQDALAKMEQQLAVQRSIDANVTKMATGITAPGLSSSFAPTSALSGSFDASNVFGPIAQSTADTLGATATAAQTGLADINLAYGSSVNFLGQAAQQAGVQSNNFGQSLGSAVGAIGGAAGAIMGIAAGIGQMSQGGTSGVLGGLGSIFMTLGGAIGGIGGMFGGGGGLSSAFSSSGPTFNPSSFTMPRLFANGGVVNGPTLGLVGEGKYSEAIVPLPDGRSIPVQMRGNQQSSRDLLANQRQQQASMPNISMSFQTSTINGVEYVSRDQLEQAMAATRRQAAADGASRGMNMTLDKLQQSPSTRSRLGMGGR